QRQVRCDFAGTGVQLVYEGNFSSVRFDGQLMCQPLGLRHKQPCPYTCAETAQCSKNKVILVCACLKGYVDISKQFGKPAGSILSALSATIPTR
ncbi:hypothetical protein PENTCL1PPCAC_13505, partial [Pristionchus entomophagus]